MQPLEHTLLGKLFQATLWEWVGLLTLCVVGGWVVAKLRAWSRDDRNGAVIDHEMLNEMQQLHGQGELTDTEYRSIKSQISERIRRKELQSRATAELPEAIDIDFTRSDSQHLTP